MPLLETKGAASAQGFGLTTSNGGTPQYIEDYFATTLYMGSGEQQRISTGVALGDTAGWSLLSATAPLTYFYGNGSVDSSGNIYTAAMYQSGGTTYGLVVKFNSAGAVQWQRAVVDTGTGNVLDPRLIVDASGNVYASMMLYDGTREYFFIAKYDTSGVLQWQRKWYHTTGTTRPYGIGLDASGNVLVTGESFTAGTVYAPVLKYSSAGALVWQRGYTNANAARGYAITGDSADNVIVGGAFNDAGDFDPFVAKYDSSGSLLWNRRIVLNSGRVHAVYGVTTDSSNNVYACGVDLTSTNIGFVVKLDSSGTTLWQKNFIGGGVTDSNAIRGVAVSASGDVYVSGVVANVANSRIPGVLLVKLNSSGALQWQRQMLVANSVGQTLEGVGVALDASGNVYWSGYAAGSSGGGAFIAKLKQDGTTLSGSVGVFTVFPGNALDVSLGASITSGGGSTITPAGTATTGTATDSAGAAAFTSGEQVTVTGNNGLVWLKMRSGGALGGTANNILADTSRGTQYSLFSNTTAAQAALGNVPTVDLSGFSVSSSSIANEVNGAFASWVFKEQQRFVDVVTYTGAWPSGPTSVPHSLGVVPGFVIIKNTSNTADWAVFARTASGDFKQLYLNTSGAAIATTSAANWATIFTTTDFNVFALTQEASFPVASTNASGNSYVAYLFAHNAGGFGPSGADNVISCGSYVANDSTNGPVVTLGWEPQWLLIKNASTTGGWLILDTLRGASYSNTQTLFANTNDPEAPTTQYVSVSATGFQIATSGVQDINFPSGATFVYIAIRRGPMRTPTDATKVFAPVVGTAYTSSTASGGISTSFTVDSTWVGLASATSGSAYPVVTSRLTNDVYISTPSNGAEGSWSSVAKYDRQTGFGKISFSGNIGWATQRAPKFFDVACYIGIGAQQTVYHGLNAVPELMILKKRSSGGIFTANWYVYAPTLFGIGTALLLNSSMAAIGDGSLVSVGASNFVAAASAPFSEANQTYIAQLWVTCPGVSKVGTYTGTGTTQTVNCGFTGGARFVLIKRTDGTGDWYVWDSAQGISSGNDPYILLNTGTNQTTGTNYVDAAATGFQITSSAPAAVNANGGTYLFLAIA